MGHYAKIDSNNIVIQVIVAKADFINTLPDRDSYIKTSYNTMGGIHYQPSDTQDFSTPNSDQSKSLRKNYAGIGSTYDSTRDAFIPPKPMDMNQVECASWVIDDTTCLWKPPIDRPAETDAMIADQEIWEWDEAVHQADTGNPKTQGWVVKNVNPNNV